LRRTAARVERRGARAPPRDVDAGELAEDLRVGAGGLDHHHFRWHAVVGYREMLGRTPTTTSRPSGSRRAPDGQVHAASTRHHDQIDAMTIGGQDLVMNAGASSRSARRWRLTRPGEPVRRRLSVRRR